MNDASEHALLVEPATPISANPWRDPNSFSNTLQSTQSHANSLLIPPITATRGRSTSIASGGATSSLAISIAGNAAAAATTGNSEQIFSSSLRPRARLRRLRSDQAFSDHDTADTQNEEMHGSTSTTPPRSSDKLGFTAANGSTVSLGASRGLDTPLYGQNSSSRSITPSTSSHGRRKTSGESHPPHLTSSSSDFDWDEDDKTREGKARKQGKGARRAALPSPFSFTLGSGFGSKLWGDVETLWNETLSPSAVYNHKSNPGQSGHAYLDVWGRPVAAPPSGEPEGSRGRDRGIGGQKNAGGRNRGPLVEREDVSTSTTPALSRKTTDTFKERNRSRNLISSEGINILDPESLLKNKNADVAETEVFEHIIRPADSLAGVALKYGVTVAQLRKCNKMWASDTIHLRKVLYIPVTSIGTLSKKSPTSHIVSGELIDLTTNVSQSNVSADAQDGDGDPYDLQTPIATHPRGSTYSSPSSKSTSYISSSPSPSAYIRTLSESTSTVSSLNPSKSTASTPSTKRIPISELSYFPPPSMPSTTIFTSNPHPSTISAGIARKWELQNGISSSLFASSSSPSTSSLSVSSQPSSRTASPARNTTTGLASSIFQAFPSLNDITSRVSFETVRSTGSLPESGNVSGEEDMELDEMKRRNGVAAAGGVPVGAGAGSMPSRGMRKRVKVRPKGAGAEGATTLVASDEGKGRGKVITQQLAPLRMELPDPNGSTSRRDGSYGSGWMDPDAP